MSWSPGDPWDGLFLGETTPCPTLPNEDLTRREPHNHLGSHGLYPIRSQWAAVGFSHWAWRRPARARPSRTVSWRPERRARAHPGISARLGRLPGDSGPRDGIERDALKRRRSRRGSWRSSSAFGDARREARWHQLLPSYPAFYRIPRDSWGPLRWFASGGWAASGGGVLFVYWEPVGARGGSRSRSMACPTASG